MAAYKERKPSLWKSDPFNPDNVKERIDARKATVSSPRRADDEGGSVGRIRPEKAIRVISLDGTSSIDMELPDVFKRTQEEFAGRPDSSQLAALRPSKPQNEQPNYLEVFPRTGGRTPWLLQELELMLAERLRLAEKVTSGGGRSAGVERGAHGDPAAEERSRRHPGAANLRLDAHRQCFDAFINAFGTYRPLLLRIKEEYDTAIDRALRSEHENMYLRTELAAAEQRRQKAIDEARAATRAEAATLRGELALRLQEAETRAAAAEEAAAATRAELAAAQEESAKASAEALELTEQNRALKARMFEESSWGQKAIADDVKAVIISSKKEEPPKAAPPPAEGAAA